MRNARIRKQALKISGSSMTVVFKPKEGVRERFDLFWNGEKWCEVHRAIFGKSPALPAVDSEEALQAAFDLLEYRRVRAYVLWRLSAQSYHSEQLAKLLRERLVQNKTIARVIKEYQERGFWDDDAWIHRFVAARLKRYGRSKIILQLRLKGISAASLESLAQQWPDPEQEQQVLLQLLHTKYHTKQLSDYPTRRKVIAALVRKGYAWDQVGRAIQAFLEGRRST